MMAWSPSGHGLHHVINFYVVSGAGVSAVNGTYSYTRQHKGAPLYAKEGGNAILYYDGGLYGWRITDQDSTDSWCYSKTGTSGSVPCGQWTTDGYSGSDVLPCPTVTRVGAESVAGSDPMRQALYRLALLSKSASDTNGPDSNGPDTNGPEIPMVLRQRSSNSTCLQLFFLCASAGFVALSIVPWLNAQADTGFLFFTPPWPPLPPPLDPRPPPPMLYNENGCQCANTCRYAGNDSCDDGGPQSAYDVCALGYDCTDCGVRCLPPSSPPRLPPSPPLAPLPTRPSLPPAHPPRPPSDPRGFPRFKTRAEYQTALFVPFLSTSFFFVLLMLRQCCVRYEGEVTRGEGFGCCLCVLSTLALIVILPIGRSEVGDPFTGFFLFVGLLFGMLIPMSCLQCMTRIRFNQVFYRVEMIEGDLLKFLAAGIIRLVSVTWLLSQPPDWIAVRRQVS